MKIDLYDKLLTYYVMAMTVLLLFLAALWLGLYRDLRMSAVPTAPTVGMVFPRSVDTWNDSLREDLAAAAEERGFCVSLAETDLKLSDQITEIRSFILNKAACIILDPVTSFGWDTILSEAAEAGIPVITVNHSLNTQSESGAGILYQVTFDYQEAGELLARSYLESRETEADGASLILTGNVSTRLSTTINAGLRAGFVQAGTSFHAYNSTCGEMQSKAEENLRSLIRNNDSFQVIFSHNSAMALGCIQAFGQYGLSPGTDIAIFAFGGGADLDAALADGRLSGYALCDTKALSGTAANLIVLLSMGNFPEAHEYLIPCQLRLHGGA